MPFRLPFDGTASRAGSVGRTSKARWLDTGELRRGDYHETLVPLIAGEYRGKTEEAVRGSGYVVESLEAALWYLWHSDSFDEAVLRAANLGDDADTTAAVTGQLAGAFYGVEMISAEWLEVLHQRERVQAAARSLWRSHRGG